MKNLAVLLRLSFVELLCSWEIELLPNCFHEEKPVQEKANETHQERIQTIIGKERLDTLNGNHAPPLPLPLGVR